MAGLFFICGKMCASFHLVLAYKVRGKVAHFLPFMRLYKYRILIKMSEK